VEFVVIISISDDTVDVIVQISDGMVGIILVLVLFDTVTT